VVFTTINQERKERSKERKKEKEEIVYFKLNKSNIVQTTPRM
jgi:hypothetical protein